MTVFSLGAFLVVGALPHGVRVLWLVENEIGVVFAVARRGEVFRRDFAEVEIDRGEQLPDAVGRCDRGVVEGEVEVEPAVFVARRHLQLGRRFGGCLRIGLRGRNRGVVDAQAAEAGLRPQERDGDFGELEIVVQIRQRGDQRRQHDALAVGPDGVAFLDAQPPAGEAADEIAQHRRDVVEQRAGGIVLVLRFVEGVDLFHHPQRVLQAAAVEHVAGMHRPRFEQAPLHARQQRGRAAAELPGERDVGRGDAANPAEDEVLLVARQRLEVGGFRRRQLRNTVLFRSGGAQGRGCGVHGRSDF